MKKMTVGLLVLLGTALTSGCGDDRLIQYFTAIDDSYAAVGNVPLAVSAGSGLLANDGDGEVTDFDATTTAGGTVAVGADGGFVYSPPTGFTGVDTFGYENDGGLLATVSISVTGRIWFIDDTAAAGGDGAYSAPFDSLAAFNAANGGGAAGEPAAGDTIFLHAGSHAPYDGGIVLLAGQVLLGEGVDLVANAMTVVPAGTRPIVTNSAGHGIVLADANTVMGLDVQDTLLTGISGTDVSGTTRIDHVEVRNAGGSCLAVGGAVTGLFVVGDAAAPDVVFDGSGLNAIFFDSDGATLQLGGVAVPNAGLSGIFCVDSHVTMDTCFVGETALGVPGAIGQSGVLVLESGAASSLGMVDCVVTQASVRGVLAQSLGGATLTLDLDGLQVEDCTGGLLVHDVAAASDGARVALRDCTFGPCGPGTANLDLLGTVLDSIYVTEFARIVVEGDGAGGGVRMQVVTCDADPDTAGVQSIFCGSCLFGTPAGRIGGDGLRFEDCSGGLGFSDLDIANVGGTGLYIDTKGLGTAFSIGVTGGVIDTVGGPTSFLDPPVGMPPLRLDLTFDALRSTGSSGPVVIVDNARGSLRVREPVKGRVVLRNASGLRTRLR